MPGTMKADVVVIGLGPGGEDVAGNLVGGECPYWGCVPSKMMIRAANLLAEGRRIPGMAGRSIVEADYAPVATRIREEATDDWDDKVAVDRFTGKGGHFLRGRGRLSGPGTVEVTAEDGTLTTVEVTRGVVLATGTVPSIPPIPGLADVP